MRVCASQQAVEKTCAQNLVVQMSRPPARGGKVRMQNGHLFQRFSGAGLSFLTLGVALNRRAPPGPVSIKQALLVVQIHPQVRLRTASPGDLLLLTAPVGSSNGIPFRLTTHYESMTRGCVEILRYGSDDRLNRLPLHTGGEGHPGRRCRAPKATGGAAVAAASDACSGRACIAASCTSVAVGSGGKGGKL